MDEQELLQAVLLDKARQCEDEYRLTFTHFLSPAQRAAALETARVQRLPTPVFFFGGYPDAERAVAVFAPDYLQITNDDALADFFLENDTDCPLCLIRIQKDAFTQISHRDYLGALTGLGLKRETLGDILVHETGCDLFALKSVCAYICEQLCAAGRATVHAQTAPLTAMQAIQAQPTPVFVSVKSPRLDAVAAACFSISRTAAAQAVARGIVFVNGAAVQKPEKYITVGDTVTLRGKDRCVIREIGGNTRSGRVKLMVERY